MKDLSSRWAVGILLAPVLLILGLALMGGSNQASAKAPPNGKATVAVAFISSFSANEPITSYQRVALNVISVRLSPKTDPNLSVFDSSWVSIPVPGGVGRNVGIVTVSTGNTFGGYVSSGNNVAIGEGKSEIQVDLNAIQNIAEIFNAFNIPAKKYNQVELVLDASTPGNVIPLCPIGPGGEGCITYPAALPVETPTPTNQQTIRAPIPGGLDLSKSQRVVTPLVIQIDPNVGAPPIAFNQPVQIDPVIEVIPNSGGGGNPFINQALPTIQGTIKTSTTFSSSRPETITAEIAGTNNIIETIFLPNSCNGKNTCDFILYLPALDESVGGTNYDLVAAGKNTSYAVVSNINVSAGRPSTVATPLTIVTKPTVNFNGKVVDTSSGTGIEAATLNLMVPAPGVPLLSCALTPPPPTGCVVAATASTDEVGNFPLPGNGNNKAPFNLVPLPGTAATDGYLLITTAAGSNRTLTSVKALQGALKCDTSRNKACFVQMDRGLLTGNVTLGGGATGPVTVLVMAEQTETNNIQNMTLVTIRSGNTSALYSMNVPSNIGPLDLFASAQDLFNGAPQTATGHSIALGRIDTPCTIVTGGSTGCVSTADLGPLTCVGHSSVSGTVTNGMNGDTVALSQDGIMIESVPIIPPANPAAGNYALCAPPGNYQLDHLNSDGQSVATKSVTLATPIIVPTSSPSPGATPTPCPGICKLPGNTSNGCQVCKGTTNVNF